MRVPSIVPDVGVVLTVRLAADDHPGPSAVDASAGRPVVFSGCETGCCPPPDLLVHGAAGTVLAEDGRWHLTNDSDVVPIRVWNLDDPRDHVRVPPGGTVSPPFDLAAVAGAKGHVLTVFGPEPRVEACGSCVSGVPVAWGIDPTSRRHEVMLVLVAPRMLGDSAAPLPTARQIGERLGMSHRTVQEHLTALVRSLGLAPSGSRRPGWLQEALATYALDHPYVPAPGCLSPW